MPDTTLSPFDLLDLPRLQREIVIYLSREGPTGADTLAQALGRDPSEVRDALLALVEKGHVRLSSDDQAKVAFGWAPFIHGLVLWQNPLERAGALLVGTVMLSATVVMVRRGGFARRAVVELREDLRQGKQSVFNVVVDGRPTMAEVQLGYPEGEQHCQAANGTVPAFSSLCCATFQLPATPARELKVWVHRVTPAADSKSLPALLEVYRGSESVQARTEQFDLRSSSGQIVLPFNGEPCRLQIILSRN